MAFPRHFLFIICIMFKFITSALSILFVECKQRDMLFSIASVCLWQTAGPMKRHAPHLRSSGESMLQDKQHHAAADGLPNRGSVTQNLSYQPAVLPFW
jgi:hypothetical protein